MSTATRTSTPRSEATATTHFKVAIVGTGFGGLGMAIRLKRDGMGDFVVLERAEDLGGTWRDNSYPGCACDIQSSLYSFSHSPNANWSRVFSPQPEILAYLRDCAERFGVRPHIRFGHELLEATWNEATQRWEIETSRGRLTADVLVNASGPLCEPSQPALPGLDRFTGPVFHSARWNHDFDLRGRKVAVVGTGASAIQFVPEIQPLVAKLSLFQRTPAWVVKRYDRPVSRLERWVYNRWPRVQLLRRFRLYLLRELIGFTLRVPLLQRLAEHHARGHLRRSVASPELRAKLMPSYRFGCKRVLISNDYYPAVAEPNVDLVTAGITEVREHAIVTSDGAVHEVDAIIFGTGFHVTDAKIAQHIRGRGGLSLADVWKGSPRAHLGTVVAGFPNLYLLLGPNAGLGHNSVVIMLEAQIAYVAGALRHMRANGLAALEVEPSVQAAFNAQVDRWSQGTVWTAGGCKSWYIDRTGRNSSVWPRTVPRFQLLVSRFRPRDYVGLKSRS
jgi:cation diffusion facilitator CzcD-associated flavoprotein CzcO